MPTSSNGRPSIRGEALVRRSLGRPEGPEAVTQRPSHLPLPRLRRSESSHKLASSRRGMNRLCLLYTSDAADDM
eukprot:15251813-Alexandrium_andersonii.AAC.1